MSDLAGNNRFPMCETVEEKGQKLRMRIGLVFSQSSLAAEFFGCEHLAQLGLFHVTSTRPTTYDLRTRRFQRTNEQIHNRRRRRWAAEESDKPKKRTGREEQTDSCRQDESSGTPEEL